jgi:hypothetical protein
MTLLDEGEKLAALKFLNSKIQSDGGKNKVGVSQAVD